MAKTTLYRHFGSTDVLVFAVVEVSVGAAPMPDTGTVRGDLEAIHRRYPTVIALQRGSRSVRFAAETDLDLAMHVIQGPLIPQRIVDNREVTPSRSGPLARHDAAALGVDPSDEVSYFPYWLINYDRQLGRCF